MSSDPEKIFNKKKKTEKRTVNWEKIFSERKKKVAKKENQQTEELICIQPSKSLEFELIELETKFIKRTEEMKTWYAKEKKTIERKHNIFEKKKQTEIFKRNNEKDFEMHGSPVMIPIPVPITEEPPRLQTRSNFSVISDIEISNVGYDIASLENGKESLNLICLMVVNVLLSGITKETDFFEIDWEYILLQGSECMKMLSKYPGQYISVESVINLLKKLQSKNCYIDDYTKIIGNVDERTKNNPSIKDTCSLTKTRNPGGWAAYLKIGDYGICIDCPKISNGSSSNFLWVFDPQGGQEKGKSTLIKFQNEMDLSIYVKGKASTAKNPSKTYEMFIFIKK